MLRRCSTSWHDEGKGTLYHDPNPHNHQRLSIAGSPAPPKVAQQIYVQATLTKMCLRYHQGEAMEKTLAWAEGAKASCEAKMRRDRCSPPQGGLQRTRTHINAGTRLDEHTHNRQGWTSAENQIWQHEPRSRVGFAAAVMRAPSIRRARSFRLPLGIRIVRLRLTLATGRNGKPFDFPRGLSPWLNASKPKL
jgi:hypothetical protein